MFKTGKTKESIFLTSKKVTYLDPRSKLIILVSFLIGVLYSLNLYVLMCLVLFSLLLVLMSKINLKYILMAVFFLSLFSGLATLIAYYVVTKDNIYMFFAAVEIRLVSSFFMISWFFYTVSPYELSISLEKMFVPSILTWLITTIYQFIPVLSEEVLEINNIRKLKGLTAKKWKMRKQFYILRKTLKPLITGSMNRGVDLAEAMILKGFQPKRREDHLLDLHIKITDITVMLVSIAILVCIIVFFRG